MKISMNALVQIWMSPVYARTNIDAMKSWYFPLGLLFLVSQLAAIGFYVAKNGWHNLLVFPLAAIMCFGFFVVLLACIWYMVLGLFVMRQYSPSNAKLTPLLKRHMQFALVLPILFVSVIASIIYYFVKHKFSILPATYCIFLMFAVVSLARGLVGVVFFVFALQFPISLDRFGLGSALKNFDIYPALNAPLLMFVSTLILLVVGMFWFFSFGEKTSFRMHFQTSSTNSGWANNHFGAHGIGMLTARIFCLWMSRCVRNEVSRQKIAKPSQKLLPFSLGPRSHWTATIFLSVCLALCVFLLIYAIDFLNGHPRGLLTDSGPMIIGGMLLFSSPFVYLLLLFQTLYQTRAQQGLAGLAPLSGSLEMQDRAMKNYLIRQFLILFTICFLISTLAFFLDGESRRLISVALLFISCQFPILLVIVGDHTRMRAENDHAMRSYTIFGSVLFILSLVMLLIVPVNFVWLFVAIIVGGTLVVFKLASPSDKDRRAFPVGRAV